MSLYCHYQTLEVLSTVKMVRTDSTVDDSRKAEKQSHSKNGKEKTLTGCIVLQQGFLSLTSLGCPEYLEQCLTHSKHSINIRRCELLLLFKHLEVRDCIIKYEKEKL